MFWVAIFFLSIAALALLVAVPFKNALATLVAIVSGLIGIVLIIGSCMHMVPVRNVGIVTEFKKPTGDTTGSGLVWTKPWQGVTDWDASRQKWDHLGEGCLNVKTATLADACVEIQIEWQVKEDQAPRQYKEYKGDYEYFYVTRVDALMVDSVKKAFRPYDALANAEKTGNLNVPLEPFVNDVKKNLTDSLGVDLDVISVVIPQVRPDTKTQEKINELQDMIAKGRNLDQDLKNAEKQKAVSETNAKVDKVTRCLEIADADGKEPGLCLNGGAVLLQK